MSINSTNLEDNNSGKNRSLETKPKLISENSRLGFIESVHER